MKKKVEGRPLIRIDSFLERLDLDRTIDGGRGEILWLVNAKFSFVYKLYMTEHLIPALYVVAADSWFMQEARHITNSS